MIRRASLELFGRRGFRALWIGQLISIFGDRFTYLALLALIAVEAPDPRRAAPALAMIPWVSFLPTILLGPFAGVFVDRTPRRSVLLAADAARGALVLAMIPVASWAGLNLVFGLVALLYVANTFFLPARSTVLPELVPESRLVEANALTTMAGVLATVAGSIAAGAIIEGLGWRLGFAIDGATYFASVAALWFLPRGPGRPPDGRAVGAAYRTIVREIGEGARSARRSVPVRAAMLAVAILWAAGGVLHVALPLELATRGEGMVLAIGTLLAVAASGMVAGTLWLARAKTSDGAGRVLAGSLLGVGLALALVPRSTGLPLYGLVAVAGLFVAGILVTSEAMIQAASEPDSRARVFALRDVLARIVVLLTASAAGLLVGRGLLGSGAAITGIGAIVAVAGVALFGALGRDRTLEDVG